jgi:hypothetical protein
MNGDVKPTNIKYTMSTYFPNQNFKSVSVVELLSFQFFQTLFLLGEKSCKTQQKFSFLNNEWLDLSKNVELWKHYVKSLFQL